MVWVPADEVGHIGSLLGVLVCAAEYSHPAVHSSGSFSVGAFGSTRQCTDLHLVVANHLTGLDRIHLKMTSRYFYRLMNPFTYEEMVELQGTMPHGPYNGWFTRHNCPRFLAREQCLRLRPNGRVAHDRTSSNANRWCLDCELASKERRRKYKKGEVIGTYGGRRFICRSCEQLTSCLDAGDHGICCAWLTEHNDRWEDVLTRKRALTRRVMGTAEGVQITGTPNKRPRWGQLERFHDKSGRSDQTSERKRAATIEVEAE